MGWSGLKWLVEAALIQIHVANILGLRDLKLYAELIHARIRGFNDFRYVLLKTSLLAFDSAWQP